MSCLSLWMGTAIKRAKKETECLSNHFIVGTEGNSGCKRVFARRDFAENQFFQI